MVKSDTLLLLGLGGAGLYFLSKTDFFKGVGEVSSGVGEAVGGLGSGISTIGKEAGDIVVDVGSFLEPISASFQGQANLIQEQFQQKQNSLRRESLQSDLIDTSAFSQSNEILSNIQAERDINTARQKANRTEIIQNKFTDVVRNVSNFNLSSLNPLAPFTNVILGGVSAQFSKALRRDAPVSLTSEAVTGGNISLPQNSSSNNGGSSRTTSVRSSGGSSSFAPSSKLMSIAPTPAKTTSIRNVVNSTISTAASKAKSLLSKVSSKIRSIF